MCDRLGLHWFSAKIPSAKKNDAHFCQHGAKTLDSLIPCLVFSQQKSDSISEFFAWSL